MTREEKELLLKDLCARLPYGVKAKITEEGVLSYDSGIGVIVGKEHVDDEIFILQCKNDSWCLTAISEFVPYLRPMSSMTVNEEKVLSDVGSEFLETLVKKVQNIKDDNERIHLLQKAVAKRTSEMMQFYHKSHLDYNGLIEKGLALEAPEGMYNI